MNKSFDTVIFQETFNNTMMEEQGKYKSETIENIPDRLSDAEIVYQLNSKNIDNAYLTLFKKYSSLKDDVIADFFDMNVKTFRSYKTMGMPLKENVKERLILLLSLFKHGKRVFGSVRAFKEWLYSENFFFDGNAPVSLLGSVSGIRIVDSRLIAMEYGDNV
ncbi:MAG TPA: antitoxin Xre/MbcA/ParS toxin-binding domain-containing protein [Bacteroidales bacterium]|nr:antitoxin Xre/MbcA/ParS toxin-binding domain-containing protein [Bacteroidales bacterium]